jgi:hypothetical protein
MCKKKIACPTGESSRKHRAGEHGATSGQGQLAHPHAASCAALPWGARGSRLLTTAATVESLQPISGASHGTGGLSGNRPDGRRGGYALADVSARRVTWPAGDEIEVKPVLRYLLLGHAVEEDHLAVRASRTDSEAESLLAPAGLAETAATDTD